MTEEQIMSLPEASPFRYVEETAGKRVRVLRDLELIQPVAETEPEFVVQDGKQWCPMIDELGNRVRVNRTEVIGEW